MPEQNKRTLRCLIEGDSEVFSVEARFEQGIEQLKQAIHEIAGSLLENIHFSMLRLFKVSACGELRRTAHSTT